MAENIRADFKMLDEDGNPTTVGEFIRKVMIAWAGQDGYKDTPLWEQVQIEDYRLIDSLAEGFIEKINTFPEGLFAMKPPKGEASINLNKHVYTLLTSSFSSPGKYSFTDSKLLEDISTQSDSMAAWTESTDIAAIYSETKPQNESETVKKWLRDHGTQQRFSDVAVSALNMTRPGSVITAWHDHGREFGPLSLLDFLNGPLKKSIDSTGHIGLLSGSRPATDLLREVFDQMGKLPGFEMSPNFLEEWNRANAIARQGYETLLTRNAILDREMAEDPTQAPLLKVKKDELYEEFRKFLQSIASGFPSEEQMKINKQMKNEAGRQEFVLDRAREKGILNRTAGTLLEGLPAALSRAFGEIEQQYMVAGPDADYGQIVEDYFGEGGEKFQSRFGAAPPEAPGFPNAAEAQRRYQEVVARGGTARDIMQALYGFDPEGTGPGTATQGAPQGEPQTAAEASAQAAAQADRPTEQRTGMLPGDSGAAPESVLRNFIDDPKVWAKIKEFSANFDPEGLKNYLTGLYPDLGNQLTAFYQSELQAAQDDYAAGVIDQDQYNQISADLNAKIADPINTIGAVKTTKAAMDENIFWTGDPGGDRYKGQYNPYAPPKPGTNMRPGTVMYDQDGNIIPTDDPRIFNYDPITMRYEGETIPPRSVPGLGQDLAAENIQEGEDPMTPEEATELATAQVKGQQALGILPTPGKYIAGTDIVDTPENRELYRAETLEEDPLTAKSPHEIDETPPPPAPEIAQFTVRRRGGRRGY